MSASQPAGAEEDDSLAEEVTEAADTVNSHPVVVTLARLGHAVNGALHVIIAVIVLRIAWGSAGDEQADQSGALATMAGQPVGLALLWLFVAGCGCLGLWYLTEAVAPAPQWSSRLDRAKWVTKGVAYLAIAWLALRFALGAASSTSSEQRTQGVTRTLMSQPAGQWLVAAGGVVVLAVGAYYMRKGVLARFLGDLEEHPGAWAVAAGRIGYPAKGAVLGLVGVFVILAAWQQTVEEAVGLDGALKQLKGQPYGPYLLTAVAVGLVCFGVYCLARARFAALD